jgi:hypothetical protein
MQRKIDENRAMWSYEFGAKFVVVHESILIEIPTIIDPVALG